MKLIEKNAPFVFILIGVFLMIMPASCMVESGSSIDMRVVNIRTTTNARFVVTDSDNTAIELNHNIRVSDLDGVPSQGRVTAFMEGIIQEGRNNWTKVYEEIEFKERTTVDGRITLFDKNMRYISGIKR